MARATFKNPAAAFRGRIGGMIFRMRSDDTAIDNMAPNSHKKHDPNPSQTNQGQNFRSALGDSTNGIHPVYEELAKATHKSAYSIALSDRMQAPVIHRMLIRAGSILVQASDNVMVARVEVQVLGKEGEVLERGEGVRLKADWWEYIPSYAGVKITAAAWDLAGNVTKAEM